MTGETFEFQTSAKSGDGTFRFRWTLAGGKKGPPEHVHDRETETFTVVTGHLRIWVDGTPHELTPGKSLAVGRGQSHRFLNPTQEPVVVDVSLDGPLQEDVLVPLAVRFGGRTKMTLRDFFTMLVHATEVEASRPPSRVTRAIFRGMSRVARLFGARPLPLAGRW
jgi:mannose-6-phosphate isomerase-like protein (cupin superfamily)